MEGPPKEKPIAFFSFSFSVSPSCFCQMIYCNKWVKRENSIERVCGGMILNFPPVDLRSTWKENEDCQSATCVSVRSGGEIYKSRKKKRWKNVNHHRRRPVHLTGQSSRVSFRVWGPSRFINQIGLAHSNLSKWPTLSMAFFFFSILHNRFFLWTDPIK
jgi:hypothetical protein